jgi:hypothetical protein
VESLADRTDCGGTGKENATHRIATEQPYLHVVTSPEKATITNRRITNSNDDAGRTKSVLIEIASWFWRVTKCVNPLAYESEMATRMTGGNDDIMQYFLTQFNPSQRLGQGHEYGQLMVDNARGSVDADTHFPLSEYSDRLTAAKA